MKTKTYYIINCTRYNTLKNHFLWFTLVHMIVMRILKLLFFYVWQKRDFLDIFCNMIYEDNITWTIPSLNFSSVDKRLNISNLFVWTLEHYCMLNNDSLKLGAFKDKIIPIGKWRENSIGDNFFLLKLFLKNLAPGSIHVFPISKTKNDWIWSSFGRSIPNYVVDHEAFISSFKDWFFNSTIF